MDKQSLESLNRNRPGGSALSFKTIHPRLLEKSWGTDWTLPFDENVPAEVHPAQFLQHQRVLGQCDWSDDDDRQLFKSLRNFTTASDILRAKHNDLCGWSLYDVDVNLLDEKAWARLWQIMCQKTGLHRLMIHCCASNLTSLCITLQVSQSIRDFTLESTDLRNGKVSGLLPFLSHSRFLSSFSLRGCNLGPEGINLLSTALLKRRRGGGFLRDLHLDDNPIGDMDLGHLVLAVEWNRIHTLSLSKNGLASEASVSLAKLLGSQGCNLHICGNSIDDESATILADSLMKNANLAVLNLRGNYGIAKKGWMAILKLVCDGSSIDGVLKSKHNLEDAGINLEFRVPKRICKSLGVDDANLLCASLKANEDRPFKNTTVVERQKIIWSHARGNINIGADSSITDGFMPCVISLIGNDSNQRSANLIQYHTPPLSDARIRGIRLNAIHRIMRSRPGLC